MKVIEDVIEIPAGEPQLAEGSAPAVGISNATAAIGEVSYDRSRLCEFEIYFQTTPAAAWLPRDAGCGRVRRDEAGSGFRRKPARSLQDREMVDDLGWRW
jgi:hypothetical protein